jgi:alanine-glyoxylate transaminase/serine-glyoxylate transaminase/serine-pyruvate transaminase
MSMPTLSHLDPAFIQVMDETQELLRKVFRTTNRVTFPISGTGSAGMEACLVNLIEPGDRMVVCVKGYFGQRLAEVARRAGAVVTTIERPWGEVFEREEIRAALQNVRPKVFGIVHAETSTGAWQPIDGLGALCRQFDSLLLVDTVTSLGGVPVEIDAWQVDAVYSCSQKGLSCPSGLSPVSFSPRALEAIHRRKTSVQSFYLDVTLLQRYWGEERVYHHTAPTNMIVGLREGLQIIEEQGPDARWSRQTLNHRALKAGLAALGITYAANQANQLPMLNAVRIPDGVDDVTTRKRLLSEFNIEIGGGLGEFKGKVWRIGLMGYSGRANNVLLLLAALEQCLQEQGVTVPAGASVAAANRVYL